MSDNRRIRVFVSSTFRDMMGERDELMTHAWPELRRFCRERQVELVEVDLRWGIAEEQSTRKETLKLCLDEIRACRPFFIGLLGERYGWVPGNDAFTADLREEQPWLANLPGRSVTELEIIHGVLREAKMHARAFFYFRDPGYLDRLPPGVNRADFESEGPEAGVKLDKLKQSIRHARVEGICELHENYPNPVKLAAFVLEDLKAAVQAQFAIEDIPDALTREARDHEAFAETRRRTYIGRPDYFEALDRHAVDDGTPLVLVGDSGSGKSALLANWLAHWHETHPEDFIFQHYIGGTPDSAEHWRLMSRLIAEIKRWTTDPEEMPKSHDDLLKDFPVWLDKARSKAEREGVRYIVVLDALNQLEDRDHARLLGWLAEAEQLFRRALEIWERSLGKDHPDVAAVLNNLASLLQTTNRLAEAEPLQRRALAIGEQNFGKDHPNVAMSLNNLARLLQTTNRLAEAEPLMRRPLEIFLSFTISTGHQHPHLQTAIGNYAALLSQMGRSEPEILAQLNAIGQPCGIQFG